MVNPNWAVKRGQLYKKLRTGASAYSGAIRLFENNPAATKSVMFRKAISGKELTRNQKLYLLKTFGNLKRNYFIVQKARKNLSAAGIVSNIYKTLSLKPENPAIFTDSKIQELLSESKRHSRLISGTAEQPRKQPTLSSDAFGLLLTIGGKEFAKLVSRWTEIGILDKTEGLVDGVTVPMLAVNKQSGKTERIALSIVPEYRSQKIHKIVQEHEKFHRESTALGPKAEMKIKPETKQEAKTVVISELQDELANYATEKDLSDFLDYFHEFLKQNGPLIRTALTKKELRDIVDAVEIINKRAMNTILKNELIAIIRTTPLTKLKRRLQGILKYAK